MDTGILILIILSVLLLCCVIAVLVLLLAKKDAVGKEDIARLQGRVDAAERATLESLRGQRAENAQRFDALAAKADRAYRDDRAHELEMNKMLSSSLGEMREKSTEQNERQTRAINESLEKIRESNEQKLDQMRVTVGEKLDETLQKRLDSSFETVSKQLKDLYESLGKMQELSTGVTENVTALNRVLTNVKTRGTWAEVQLGGILDQIIPGSYVRNFSPQGSSATVEFAVIIPSADGGRTYMPIDSKFPVEDYLRIQQAAETADPEELKKARGALRARVFAEAKDVSSKYISVPETTPFAVLYLATEGLYAEVLSADDGLAEKLHSGYNILLAGPSTITALLNSLAMGFRTLAVNEKAAEIRKILVSVKKQYEQFGVLLEKAHKKVDEAGTVLDDAQKRNDLIRKKLGSVDSAEALPSGETVGLPVTDEE